MDEGIDTGDIILQKTFQITDKDNYSTLLETAYRECPRLLYKAINQIRKNKVKIIKQKNIHPTDFIAQKGKRGMNLSTGINRRGPYLILYVLYHCLDRRQIIHW